MTGGIGQVCIGVNGGIGQVCIGVNGGIGQVCIGVNGGIGEVCIGVHIELRSSSHKSIQRMYSIRPDIDN